MKVLITGVFGSVGSYMSEYIASKHPEVEVHGIGRGPLHSIPHRWPMDLRNQEAVTDVIGFGGYDGIFHFASNADVAKSFDRQTEILNNNILSTSVLFSVVRDTAPRTPIVLASTSEVYGVCKHGNPVDESEPIAPANPYAVSKTTQDLLAGACNDAYGMNIIRVRMFSYFNPRRSNLFSSAFARQIAEIEQGKRKVLTHGNLKSRRSFIDIQDCCEAYWLAKDCPPKVYNVGGVRVQSIEEILQQLIDMAECHIPTEEDPALVRPTDVITQVPIVDKFAEATGGWRPWRDTGYSLLSLMAHWRGVVRNQ